MVVEKSNMRICVSTCLVFLIVIGLESLKELDIRYFGAVFTVLLAAGCGKVQVKHSISLFHAASVQKLR